jgi:PAS domain S-box-containing protein
MIKDKEIKDEVKAHIKELTEVNKRLKQEMEDCLRQKEALQKSEERFRLISALAHNAFIMMDNEGKISYWNKAAERIFGYRREQVIGKDLHMLLIPRTSQEAFKKGFNRFRVTGQGPVIGQTIEATAIKNDGTEFPISLSISSIKLENKWNALGIARDISERKRAEEEIKLAHAELNQIFDTAADGMRVIDKDFNILSINETFSILSGISRDEARGRKCYEVFSAPFCHTSNCPLVRILNGEQRIGCEIEKERRDGTKIFYSVIATSYKRPDGELVGIIEDIRDITESRQILGQLFQSEKMASIGQLAAGVAHEINNPTGFVSSNLKTLSDYHNDISSLVEQYRKLTTDLRQTMATAGYPVSVSEQLERIAELEAEADIDFVLNDISDLVKESREGTERIKKIVLDLKDFAHPGEDKPRFADINRNMESTLNVVWNELKYKATVTKDYGDLPEVECYPQQLNQVFMNLLVNAAQAMEKQGEIRIVTRADDGYVEIRISDTGKGIPKENLSKIFDPFFTTKEVGKGTGLGLNVAYNIIKKHNGTIDVESTVGKGTMFTIRIPVQKKVQLYCKM